MEKMSLNPIMTLDIYLYPVDTIQQLIVALSGLYDGISYF